jgi:mannitol-specific phosphotransferase system IIBC component
MPQISGGDVKHIVIGCEAGMGSSVMLANMLAKQFKSLGIKVTHCPVNQLADYEADLIVCHRGLSQRARGVANGRVVVPFDMFLGDPILAMLADDLENKRNISDD